MPNHILFDSITYTMECPEPFNNPMFPRERTDVYSCYNIAASKKSTLHAPTLRAIVAYMKLFKAVTDGTSIENLGAIGSQSGKKIVAEYISGRGEIQAIVYNKEKNTLIF